MGFDDLRKWKDSVYTRLEGARLDAIVNILLSLGPQLRNRKYFTEGVATNGQPVAQRGKQRKRCRLRRKGSVFEDCSANRGRLRQQPDTFACNGVEDHASPSVTRDFLYPCG